MKFQLLTRNFQIVLKKEDFNLMIKAETGKHGPNPLTFKLSELGEVFEVNYYPHKPTIIYVSLDFPEPKGVRGRIRDVIRQHVKECREWYETPPDEIAQRAKRVC